MKGIFAKALSLAILMSVVPSFSMKLVKTVPTTINSNRLSHGIVAAGTLAFTAAVYGLYKWYSAKGKKADDKLVDSSSRSSLVSDSYDNKEDAEKGLLSRLGTSFKSAGTSISTFWTDKVCPFGAFINDGVKAIAPYPVLAASVYYIYRHFRPAKS